MPDEERINVPGSTRKENWTYKMIPSIEKILCDPELSAAIKTLLSN
jgi:4-alpha-glucanotransferase